MMGAVTEPYRTSIVLNKDLKRPTVKVRCCQAMRLAWEMQVDS